MKNFGKIKNIFILTFLLIVGFGMAQKASAASILRYGTESVACIGNECILTFKWTSSESTYKGIDYIIDGETTSTWVSDAGTEHEMSFVVNDGGSNKAVSVSLKLINVPPHAGDLLTATSYFTVNTRAPYLKEINSSNFANFDCDLENDADCFYETIGDDTVCTYGPGRAVNITATYDKSISGTMTVGLNNAIGNLNTSLLLNSISDKAISGTYTVGGTGSGENIESSGLDILSILAQDIDNGGIHVTNNVLPPPKYLEEPGKNLKEMGDAVHKIINIDTTAPSFSSINPNSNKYLNESAINAEEGSNSVSYYIAERLRSGAVVFKEGATIKITCTLKGAALSPPGTKNIDFGSGGDCSEGDVTASFIDGTTYSMQISGTDLVGNASSITTVSGIIYDKSAPVLESFDSGTPDGTYDPNDINSINIKAIFAEPLLGSRSPSLSVTLNNGKTLILNAYATVGGKGELSGSYAISARGSGESKGDLDIESITSSSNICDLSGNCSTINTSSIPSGQNLADNTNIGVDTMGYNIQYFSDGNLTSPVPIKEGKIVLKAGTYYLKITSLESLGTEKVPSITIGAEGSANDISAIDATSVGGNVYKLARTISSDAEAVGSARESITISGENIYAHSKTVAPENTSNAGYTDTILPLIESFNFNGISDQYLNIGTNNITITFSEAIDSESLFTLKLDTPSATCVNGSFGGDKKTWSCQLEISSGGETVLYFDENSENPNDLAGNELADGSFYTKNVTIEGTPPSVLVVDGVDENWVTADTINVSISDPDGSGVNGQWYGFVASDAACKSGASISNSFTDNNGEGAVDFTITGNHTEYLCVRAQDKAGNETFKSLGQLNVDNKQPTIYSIKAVELENGNEVPIAGGIENYSIGEEVHLKMEFSEPVKITGILSVDFNAGFSCPFLIQSDNPPTSDICTVAITSEHTSVERLLATAVNGIVKDRAGNNLDASLINNVPENSDRSVINNFKDQNIVIKSQAVILESFSASPASGTYGPPDQITINANYDDDLAEGSRLVVVLNNGVEVTLASISGNTLSGIYDVGDTGSGQDVSSLQISTIKEHAVRGKTNDNLQDSDSLPGTNLASGLNIDTSAPQFNNVSPASDANIANITDNSDISFYLTENLSSGTIEFVPSREGQIFDDGGTKTCTLIDLNTRARSNFNTATGCSETITLVSGARYDIKFYGLDNYGNSGGTDSSGNPIPLLARTNIGFDINLDAPEISNCQIVYPNSSTATISWTTDEKADTAIDYGISNSYGKKIEDNLSEVGTSHLITLYDLTPNTFYYFRMRSTNLLGNESYSNRCKDYGIDGDAKFKTASIDPPEISNIQVPDDERTCNSVKITWDTDESSNSFVEYGKDTSYDENFGSESMVFTHSVVLPSDLEANTKYYFRVKSQDNTGDQSVTSEDSNGLLNFSTLDSETCKGNGEGDGSLSISNIKVTQGDTPNSVIVTWTTDSVANGMIRYGLDDTYGQTAGEDLSADSKSNFVTSHSVTLKDLLSNSTYNYKVISYDRYGNISASGNLTFSTATLQLISEPKVTNANAKSAVIIWETIDPSFTSLEYGTSTSYGKTYSSEVLTNLHRVELSGLQSSQVYHFKIKGGKSSDLIYSRDYMFGTF